MFMELSWQAFGAGLLMQAAIIMSLGMQNIYIIKKSIRREYPFWVALTCGVCEVLLMILGVLGAGVLLKLIPGVEAYLLWIAAGFLLVYGSLSLYRTLRKDMDRESSQDGEYQANMVQSILAAVGFSLLNPQAIIESVVFFGGTATKFGDSAAHFLAGAVAASFIWFFALASFTTFVVPKTPSRRSMRILEATSGGILISIGMGMLV